MRAAGGKGRVGYLYYILHPRTENKLTTPASRLDRSASHITGRSPDVNSNAPRIPPSQHWWLGGLGGMRDWKAWRGTGIGEAGRGRTQQISSKHWSKAIENLLMFY